MERKRTYLCDFAKGPAFLPEVDDNTAAAVLGLLDGLLDAEDEIRPARADIRTKDIAPIALPALSAKESAAGQPHTLTSSWMRRASFLDGSDMFAGSPKQ